MQTSGVGRDPFVRLWVRSALRPGLRRDDDMLMLRRILIALLAVLILGFGIAYLYLRSSLPQVEGRIAVPGLRAPVTIARDRDGVPLITAADDADAAFGLGFAHAQDRLFQMEMMRRYGAGRLSEVL